MTSAIKKVSALPVAVQLPVLLLILLLRLIHWVVAHVVLPPCVYVWCLGGLMRSLGGVFRRAIKKKNKS